MFTKFSGSFILKRITSIEIGSSNFFHAASFPINLHSELRLPANSWSTDLVNVCPSSVQFDDLLPVKLCGIRTKAHSGARGK